ncbi:hypothetical protein VCRA2113O326_370001 [Vibrio crassostreae]|nr:hypothetical protein VCRA2113O326_370001 [Vibrio crassostreae]CAK2855988.1 hypothetical protein VCRA2113O321_380001 [Vibrio crassostreae]
MAKPFWTEDDYSASSDKIRYMCDYTLKMGRKKELREVQIQKLADLTYQADVTLAVDYFESLPSNFKNAFKTAWRQKVYKKQRWEAIVMDGEVDRIVKVVEVSSAGESYLERLVELFVASSGIDVEGMTKPRIRGLALEWATNNVTK